MDIFVSRRQVLVEEGRAEGLFFCFAAHVFLFFPLFVAACCVSFSFSLACFLKTGAED